MQIPSHIPSKESTSDPVFRQWLLGVLNANQCTIEFTKSNGEVRKMLCTRLQDKLPAVPDLPLPHHNHLTVWDLDNQGWRSFRYDSIKSIKFSL